MYAAAFTPTWSWNTAKRAGSPPLALTCHSTGNRKRFAANDAACLKRPLVTEWGIGRWPDTIGVAGVFKPGWCSSTAHSKPWLAAMVILPWVWWLQQMLLSGVALRVGGICLLVLMVGWPLAMCIALGGLPVIAQLQTWGHSSAMALPQANNPAGMTWLQHWFDLAPPWSGRARYPPHWRWALGWLSPWAKPLFVYILGRGSLAPWPSA